MGRPLRPARPGEAPPAAVASAADPPVRIPFPPKPKISSQAEPPVADATPSSPPADPAPAIQPSPAAPPVLARPPPTACCRYCTGPGRGWGVSSTCQAKFPTLTRFENGAVVEGPEAAMVTHPPAAAEGNVGEVKKTAAVAAGRTNGAAAARVAPRLDAKTRPTASPDRAKASVFNAFWPATPRRDKPAASAPSCRARGAAAE